MLATITCTYFFSFGTLWNNICIVNICNQRNIIYAHTISPLGPTGPGGPPGPWTPYCIEGKEVKYYTTILFMQMFILNKLNAYS